MEAAVAAGGATLRGTATGTGAQWYMETVATMGTTHGMEATTAPAQRPLAQMGLRALGMPITRRRVRMHEALKP